eukprot:CAMPEP_0115056656 /NCGR_PEP_ID=MMETSP0227-20121206/5314_1 /TAXON_ID=89957 /ORGANISM="Polarella glacialis, Strain CCMP 1383" /LENGTH=746 /DNA_ID=CAMNT_0002441353 /DNA_START=165 /DNA_END=2405 /DNA_ORIENTATION=+
MYSPVVQQRAVHMNPSGGYAAYPAMVQQRQWGLYAEPVTQRPGVQQLVQGRGPLPSGGGCCSSTSPRAVYPPPQASHVWQGRLVAGSAVSPMSPMSPASGSRDGLRRPPAQMVAAAAMPASKQVNLLSTPLIGHRQVLAPVHQHQASFALAAERRQVNLPMTPATEHRQVLRVPAQTPSLVHREVRQVVATPHSQHREVRISRAPGPAVFTVPQSPMVQMRTVSRPLGGSSSSLLLQSPMSSQRRLLLSPSLSTRTVERLLLPTTPGPDAETVSRIVDMCPQSPQNQLVDFLRGVVAREIVPAMYYREAHIDLHKHYDKRRVQNLVRRQLEALQDWDEQGAHARRQSLLLKGLDVGTPSDVAGKVFDELLRIVFQYTSMRRRPSQQTGLDQQTFLAGLHALRMLPQELTAGDRVEVFAALLVPSVRAVQQLCEGRQALPTLLTRALFIEGLSRVPFNLPEFPVPLHLIKDVPPSVVAQDLAHQFSDNRTGLDQVKDFYLTGLISMEEIQVALDYLVVLRVLEEALEMIANMGTRHFTQREWQQLVPSQVTSQPPEPSFAETIPQVAPESPAQQYRQLWEPASTAPGGRGCAEASLPSWDEDAVRFPTIPEQRCHDDQGRFMAVTEPLPSRDVRSEEPVMFRHRAEGLASSLDIDWNTVRRASSQSRAHQADEGKRARLSEPEREPVPNAASPLEEFQIPQADSQALRTICLNVEGDSPGPLIAYAFIRCCKIYEEQRLLVSSPSNQ